MTNIPNFLRYSKSSSSIFIIGAIFLDLDYHGQGIGKALMDRVAQLHPILEVEVFKKNTIGRAFFDRYGFRVLKEHVHEGTGRVLLRIGYEGGMQRMRLRLQISFLGIWRRSIRNNWCRSFSKAISPNYPINFPNTPTSERSTNHH